MNEKYLQYFDDIRAILTSNLEADARDNAYHNMVAAVINEKFEGKAVNKRVVKLLLSRLPAGASVVDKPSGQRFLDDQIVIWGIPGHETYDNRLTFYLKRGEDFSIAAFHTANPSTHEPARKRNNRRAAHLNSFGGSVVQKAASAIDNFNRARAQLDAALALLEDDNSEIRRALVEGAEGKDRR